jgi:hypothetical protein
MLNHKKRRPFGPVKFGEPFDVVWMEKDLGRVSPSGDTETTGR